MRQTLPKCSADSEQQAKMAGFTIIVWVALFTVGGLFMVFVKVDEGSPFYKIKSFTMNEQAKMQLIGHRIDDFLKDRNDSKYISLMLPSCGGLCNMFYRYLSIYGIGRTINRIPFIEQKMKCFQDTMPEFQYALPNFHRAIKFMRSKGRRLSGFGHNCCQLDNVTKLERLSKDKIVIVRGSLLQAYGYFHQYKDEIRYLLTFSKAVRSEVDTYANELFGFDRSHKFCVHTRLGDFKKHFLLESTYKFTNPALEFTARHLKKTYNDISLILLGLDTNFTKQIHVPTDLFVNQYAPKPLNRTSDLYFGTRYCDSLLMTASGSTFAWWMAYLMTEEKQNDIFYNIETAKKKDFGKNTFDYDSFLPEWKRLRQLANGSIVFEPRWHYQLKDAT